MIHVVVCDLGYVLDDLLFEVENLTVFSHVKSQLWHCQTWWKGECLCLIFVPSFYLIAIAMCMFFLKMAYKIRDLASKRRVLNRDFCIQMQLTRFR